MAKPKYRSTELLPSHAIVYFDICYQRYQVDEDVSNLSSDPTDDEYERYKLAKQLDENPNDVVMLERQAISEVSKLLGVRVVEESEDRDCVSCKFGVSSWKDVQRIWSQIWRNVSGGDDNICLETPYMEAQQFVLYPRGLSGPRFGPNEKGDVEQWIEDHKPSPMTEENAVVDMGPKDNVVATWPDGSLLRRLVIQPDETTLVFELWTRLGTRMCRLDLWNFNQETGAFAEEFKLVLTPKSDEIVLTKGHPDYVKHLAECRRKISWFLLRNTPAAAQLSFPAKLVEQLQLPRHLPAEFAALKTDEGIDRLAHAVHRQVAKDEVVAHLDVFDRTKRVLGTEDQETQETEDSMSLPFRTAEGQEMSLHHGRLAGPDRRSHRGTVGEEYHPPWPVETTWVRENGPASWYVVDEGTETVVGAGRSPVDALSDTPFLVWPGEDVEWGAAHLEEGELASDPEIWLLLGQWPSSMWYDREFLAFVAAERG